MKKIAFGFCLFLLVASCKDTPFVPDEPIPDPVIIHFYVEPGIISVGDMATLNWSVQHATTIMIQQNVTPTWIYDATPYPEGSTVVYPQETSTFTIYANNTKEMATKTIEITVK